ncbi:PEP-CTERM sorting domain-containing protein [Desulfococcaceae bacterium HSG9]|nr:PEP-CTERM sorting domain-containing protein [Desulfococcaceae bacterium HSG9]
MKKGLAILTGVVFGLVLFTGGAMAYDYGANFGRNITISDEDYRGSGWYSNREDQEVEPGDTDNQDWDLEAMFLGDNTLTMVMGYDFMDGQDADGWIDGDFESGDIYFDTTGSVHRGTADAEFGTDANTPGIDLGSKNGNKTEQYNWGYDLVFDIDFDSFELVDGEDNEYTFDYDIVELLYDEDGNALSSNTSGWFRMNDESGAWRYDSGGNVLGSGTGSYLVGLDNGLDGEGITGGSHNAVSVNLASAELEDLLDPTTFVSHFTMQCGNDNLMGDPVPEPSTIILLGLGILGLVGFRKKFIK